MNHNDAHFYHQVNTPHINVPTDDERLMAVLIYVTSFFTSIIGPLLIWLIKRDTSRFVDISGKNYFNFIISYSIWSIVASLLMFVLIGFVILPIVLLLSFIFHIVAIIKAYNGEDYLPPLSIRFFK
ncbi:DUF4870 domain-containing protein [Staphylococcus chromogenes]|uniref:DUF4870 domain-containing protein n=1 Tax=Staphylococcus chromogenes TaxID=46126 RepID=UPI000CD24B33|nr:DUF4870 domain-containing protein [Staphylococcus chromogenes]MBP0046062.1 DUF4870 domain-containing protein [Staphylococcus chromogenes]PNY96291.1 DUF4870 domain-containing protein [Staphylococcus chromogenes]RIM03793.1 DUF4870 domain-containing protein [Staphylococcus chromogenes]SUM12155.1 Uncharacterized protein conserved in bacteria [Staphylococcus chromogenes]GGI32146.1 membrane protein [Staphylococcus chromogenes]